MSRDIEKMHPKLKARFELFRDRMQEAGLAFIVTSVDRTVLDQMALYVQGRLDVIKVNMFRDVAGLGKINSSHNRVVTSTLNSQHITNMYDGRLDNNYSRAFDIALMKFNRPHWDLKTNVNLNEIPDYHEAGKIAKSCGLAWGGAWHDYCHFQINLK